MAHVDKKGSPIRRVFALSSIRRLTFADAELERGYRAYEAKIAQAAVRRGTAFGALGMSLFALLDVQVFAANLIPTLLFLRLVLGNLVFLSVFGITYFPVSERYSRLVTGATPTFAAVAMWTIMLIANQPDVLGLYYVGIVLALFFDAFLFGRCWAGYLVSASFIAVLYMLGALFAFDMDPITQIISITFVLATVLVGLAAAYAREDNLRNAFALGESLRVQRDKASASNVDLERRVAARMAEAVALNANLQEELVQRQRAERDLAAERDLLSSILQEMNDIVVIFDPVTGKPVRWNPAILRLTGHTIDEVKDRRVPDDWMSPEDTERVRTAMSHLSSSGRSAATVHLLHKDGSRVPVEFMGSLLHRGDDKHPLMIALGRNLSERQRAQQALRASRERLDLALRSTNMGIWEYDWQTRILHVNRRASDLFGFDSMPILAAIAKLRERIPGGNARRLGELFKGHLEQQNERFDIEYPYMFEGSEAWLSMSGGVAERNKRGEPLRTVGLVRDISDRHQLDERIRETAKLEAIGRLAGGVAHDFNNLLTVINGYGEMAMMSLTDDSELHEMLQVILEQGQRAAALTRQLLTFSRREPLDLRPLDVNDHVAELAKMLRRLIGEDVDLVLELGSELPLIEADQTQLEQVIMNLAVNARDAMPDGGVLTIRSHVQELTETLPLRLGSLDAGRYVVLEVSDAGHGMDADTLSHLFEPFYTTKPQGSGTGLGLAVVYGVMERLRGGIDVTSQVDVGTTFRLYLPVSDASITDVVNDDAPIVRGDETILLVEDETAVRNLVRLMLTGWGYKVLVAHDGLEARAMAALMERPIDLLLTDVVMPGMTGAALADELIERWPGLKVLYMTGYANSLVQEPLPPHARLLTKPLKQSKLSAALRELLADN